MTLETMSEATKRLTDAGFRAQLIVAGDRLHDPASGVDYEPAELKVIEVVRFEGESDPGDEAVLLALSTRNAEPVGTLSTPYGPAASAEQAEVLRHLHRVVATEEEAASHDAHDHVAAVLPNRQAAQAAVADLREIGLGSEHLGVALMRGEHVVFERDEEADLAVDVEAGVASGAVVGFMGGMLLFALAVPGVGTIGAGGIAALGAASGIGGAMMGTFFGIGAASEEFDSHQAFRDLRLEPEEVVVVACGHDHPDRVEAAMARHGGRIIHPGR